MRIMVVDDDTEIVGLVRRGLAYEGYTVETAFDGAEALEKARNREPDLVVLDLMMPGMDGLEVCKRLRQGSTVPVLMLTARSSVADRLAGFESGADDYLVKPFAFDELLARVKALLRRRQPADTEVLRFSDLSLDTATREVRRGSDSIELTAQEFELMELFLRNPRQVLKRGRIHDRVWGDEPESDSNVLEVYVRYLRSKLEINGHQRLIHTVRGVGYILREETPADSSKV